MNGMPIVHTQAVLVSMYIYSVYIQYTGEWNVCGSV